MQHFNDKVHAVSWAAQGDIQIKCTQEWSMASFAQDDKRIIISRSPKDEMIKVSFYNEAITCSECKNGD